MAYWKVHVYKIEETACNVCLDVLTEWGGGGGLNQMMLRCLFLLWHVFKLVAEVAMS